MGQRCKQKIELLTLMHKQRIEEINFEFEKKLKEKDKEIKNINLAKENLETSFYKRLNNMSKNYMGRIRGLKNQIEEKDKEISRLRFQLASNEYN